MKKTNHPIQNMLVRILFSILFMIMFPSVTIAQDLGQETGRDLFVSANVLTVSARGSSDWMSISYSGLPGSNSYTFQSDASEMDVESSEQNDLIDLFGKTANQMTRYFSKYVKVENRASNEAEPQFLMKSKVDTVRMNPSDFGVNVSLHVGYDDKKDLVMDGIRVESYWLNTFVNATYDFEKGDVEIGLSSSKINEHLMDGMKLEFQTNPQTGSAALLLSTSF